MSLGRSFTEISSRSRGRNALVRTVASISVRNARQIRSSSSDGTASSCSSSDRRMCIRVSFEPPGGVERQGRVEARVEQLHEQAGDRRLSDERLLDVLPAESEADLAQIAAIEPEHGDLVVSRPPSRMSRLSPSDSIVPVTSPTNARCTSARWSSSMSSRSTRTPIS